MNRMIGRQYSGIQLLYIVVQSDETAQSPGTSNLGFNTLPRLEHLRFDDPDENSYLNFICNQEILF